MARDVAIDVPGREGDLARLQSAYARLTRTGKAGDTLYVTGVPGSGRTTLLRAFAEDLTAGDDPPTLLSGAFENGRFVSWDDSGPPPERVRAVVEKVVSLPEGLTPFAALVGLAMSRGTAALELVRTLFERSDRIAPTDFLTLLVREMCSEGPVVLLIDDADHAPGGVWGDAVLELAERVALDQPLLFVQAIERPAQLDAHEDDEPESLYVARRLRGRGQARWVALDLVTIEQLEGWTGPAAPDVLERLADASGGRAAWAAHLWRHWQASETVVAQAGATEDETADDGARWTFAVGGRERTLDAFDDVLGRRLATLRPATALPAPARRRSIACASCSPTPPSRDPSSPPTPSPAPWDETATRSSTCSTTCCCATTSIPTASCTRPARSTSRTSTAPTTTCGSTASARRWTG